MDRRMFIAGASVFLAAPPAVDAQPVGKARIGLLSHSLPSDTHDAVDAFRAKLRDSGYREGENLVIESRYAEGRSERLPQLAAELVRLKVDVIFTYATPASLAAKNATSMIPVVFGFVADPVSVGLVRTVSRPGGNVTGVTTNNAELIAKRISLLKELIPAASRVAVLANPGFQPTQAMVAETSRAARALGIQPQVVEAREHDQLMKAFEVMTAAKAQALIVLPDAMFIAQRRRIVAFAAASRIPAIYGLREFAEAGGLISYGVDRAESFRQSAVLVDKVLKGAKPADLPVEQPWRFGLVVNHRTAKALGVAIPSSILLRADQILD